MPLISPKKPVQFVSIEVRYIDKEDGGITLIKDDEEVQVAPEAVTGPLNVQTDKFVFRIPNWGDTKSIMSACSQVGADGKIAFDGYKFIDLRLKKLLMDWSIMDDKEKRLPITDENISMLPFSVVMYLNEHLEKVPSIASAFGADVKA